MKAIRVHQFGDEGQLKYEDVPGPEPGPREVVIKVAAASVNRADLLARAGQYGAAGQLPFTPGTDVAGVVAAVGPEVRERQLGQRVLALLANGGYAEYVAVHEAATNLLPDSITFEDAASIPVVFGTAWFCLAKIAALTVGEDVLIQAGASGVGTAAIQIAKYLGARVITTAGSPEKLAKVLALGADEAIDYTQRDFAPDVMRLTKGKGVAVVLEMVGGEVYRKSVEVLARGGRLVSMGWVSGPAPKIDEAMVKERGLSLSTFGLQSEIRGGGVRRALDELLGLFETGRLRAIVGRTFPLRDAAAAHLYLAERRNFGKVVLIP